MEINETAKMLYIILLDRARLSQKNEGWSDTDGHVFIYFTIEALAEVLHKEIKKNNLAIRGSKEPLSPYGKFQNVFLSEKELEDIRQTIPDWKDYIERLSGYMFKKYNIRDVETEMGILQRLAKFPIPAQIWDEYHLDQKINDRGVRLDMDLVAAAIEMDTRSRKELTDTMKTITELENPNSVQQMKAWLSDNGLETDTLGKKAVTDLLKTAPPKLAQVLTLRQQLAKSPVRKYQAMEKTVCADGRARGMFQFYGANRTGRFSGRNIQLQNLPQNHLSDLAEARSLIRSGNFEAVKLLYEDVPDTLSQLIRTAFIPREGTQFLVADFSAIEARVIAWFASEKWRQDVFAKGGDIYCASASQMFKVPVEKHGINGHLRQKGKIAELALGYGGSVGALKAMGALDMGLTEDELPPLVDAWRQSNPNIVKFWWEVDRAIMEAVKFKHTTSEYGLTFSCKSGMLFITLPSERKLAYVKPKIGTNKFGGQCITYEGIGSTKKWERLDSYGPKFVENIVQATARDILCYAMQTLRYCSIVMHIHDEVVIEADPSMSWVRSLPFMTIPSNRQNICTAS